MSTETVNSNVPPEEQPHDEAIGQAVMEALAEHPEEVAAAAAADEAPVATEEQVKALAAGLAQTAQQHEHARDAEKRQDSDDIFTGPYDPEQAVQAMTDANREVIAAKAQLDASVARTKEFRKTHDEAVGRLTRICSRFDALRKRSDDPQPFLKVADDETVTQRRERLASALAARQCFVDEQGLRNLTREDLETLERWTEKPGPVPPELVAQKAHVAGEAGQNGAYCTRCGAWLGRRDDANDFPAGAFVGFDCSGQEQDGVTASDAVARAKRRHQKNLGPDASMSSTENGQQRIVRGRATTKRR